jgi:hypothetical protein
MTSYTFDQLLDFTRTTSGTFVGSNGLIQTTPASVNLLTFTQQFDNAAWLKTNTTVTANSTVAPDGTSTADTLTSSAGAGVHYMRQVATVTASTAYAFSFYVKAGTHNFIQLLNAGTVAAFANFDLANGVAGTTGAKSTASITSTGNGWYRCTVVFDDTAVLTNDFRINIVSSASAAYSQTWTTTGTETVFLWGAQLEVGSTATTYTRNNGGVFPPRFDYDPVTLAPKGILIEEQRVNLLLQSETFSTTWADFGFSLDKNYTSPSGQNTATKIVPDNATTLANNALQQDVSKSASAITYTCSIFAKAGEFNRLRLLVRDTASGANFARATFNLGTQTVSDGPTVGGTFSAASVSYQNAPNGFIRYCLTFTSGTETSIRPVLVVFDSTATTGNGTSGIFLYGAQLEAGAFATSYIPTVASQVTRTADQCAIVAPNFAPWYNQSEGTFVVDASPTNNGCYALAATDGTANEEIVLRYASGGTAAVVRDGGVIQANFGTGVLTGKNALAYKLNDFASSTNGGAAATDTSGTLPTNDQVRLGAARDGSLNINGHIRSVRYYPVRLADFQLQALSA